MAKCIVFMVPILLLVTVANARPDPYQSMEELFKQSSSGETHCNYVSF